MAKNSESINRSLFELLRSRGYAPTLLDTSGKEIPVPEEAEVFQFTFTKDGKEYGTVTASIDGLHKLVIYFGDDVADSEKEMGSDESWYKLLNHLKRFSQQHQLSFEVKNTDHLKYDMAKRDHMKKQERISEGYYPMGKKGSYSDAVPTTKIIIQHNKNIEEGEQRYRNVAKIFVENSEGERFAVPTTKPGIARVYARHIAEGGTPYDEKGKHITSLCEEYQKMGAFVRATRNGQFNESAQQLVNEGINHYQSLRETLGRMTGHRGYTVYFESWTPSLMEDETDTSNLNELFVQETLDPRIESVMPILSKLHKKVSEMKEVDALSEWADSLTEAPGAETLKHNDDTEAGNLKAFDLAEDEADLEPAIDELQEGFDDNPVASAITRRIIMQRPDLLKKFGPVKVTQAIEEIADFVGDVEEIGSSDVSGWVKQLEQSLGGVDEGIVDTIKTGVKKLDKLVTGGDKEDLLANLRKSAGLPEPMAVPNKEKEVDEGKGPLGQGDLGLALRTLRGSWSGWEQDDSTDPNIESYWYDDGEGGHYASGTIEHNLNTGEIEVHYKDDEDGADIDETFYSIGDAMNALRGGYPGRHGGKAPKHDTLASKTLAGPDDLYKTDRAGKKGTLTKARMDGMKASSQYTMRGGPKGPLPESEEFAGDYATGEAGQWRNKGPKANKPATIGDLVGESEELDEDAVDDFLAKGGEIKVGKYHKPRKSEKSDYGSKHIGGAGDKMKASRTGTAAKTIGNKIVGIGEGQEDLDALKRLLGK